MHASYFIPGHAKFGTTFRGVKPIVCLTFPAYEDDDLISYQPTSTTYTTPLFGLSFTKEGNQKKTPMSPSAYASCHHFYNRLYVLTSGIILGHGVWSKTRNALLAIRYKLQCIASAVPQRKRSGQGTGKRFRHPFKQSAVSEQVYESALKW